MEKVATSEHITSLKSSAIILICVIATGISAHIKIPLPFTPVPLTLQTAVVLLSSAWAGALLGSTSQFLVITLAVFGLPLTSSSLVLGPTFGYLIGFIPAGYLAGKYFSQSKKGLFVSDFWAFFIISLIIFVPGVAWLKQSMSLSWQQAFAMGFYPFLIGDILKCLLTAGLFRLFKRH